MKITLPQNKRLHGLLNQLGMMEAKEQLVMEASNNRTSSSRELSVDEAKVLITRLSSQLPTSRSSVDEAKERMRRKVFAMFARIGYINGSDKESRKMNQARVYQLVRDHGVCKPKELNQYDVRELATLISQLEQWEFNNAQAAFNAHLDGELQGTGAHRVRNGKGRES